MGKPIKHIVRRAFQATESEQHDTDKAWNKFKQELHVRQHKQNIGYRTIGYAATIIILLSVGVYMWYSFPGEKQPDYPVAFTSDHSHVELILANGRRIQLGQQQKDITVEELGVQILQNESEKMIHYRTDSSETQVPGEYNQLNVPKGGEFKLKLSDGSIIRVNSESTLKFPVNFTPDSREIYLQGEAFFEVTKNEKAPFRVHTGDKTVTVLGTRFNISAYPDDPFWQTTLVEGKVSVQTETSERILSPSQQCSINNKTGEMEVNTVDTELYTSWMEGKFYFKGYRFEEIVKKLERWYDFEMKYEQENIKNMRFRGVIDKDCSLEETLRFLEATTNITFDVQGKTITVRETDK